MPAYAPILVPSDLNSLIYPEIQNEITRNDGGTLAGIAIDQAIDEAKIYLTRYDIVQLFGDPTPTTANPSGIAATFPTPPLLKDICINIACWKLIKLCNANVLYETLQTGNKDAIDTLLRIQKGLADPKWPYYDTTSETAPTGDQVTIQANPVRSNYY